MVTFLHAPKGGRTGCNVEPGHVVLLSKRRYNGKGDGHVVGRETRLRGGAVKAVETAVALFVNRTRPTHHIASSQVGGKGVSRRFKGSFCRAGRGLAADACIQQACA